tara:strand:- start:6219 stop:6899 length:681 start_codon:yes stop_codon:yes gene_type:complete
MVSKNKIESISLEIANYWRDNNILNEVNPQCGTFIGFDWVEYEENYYLPAINTNIDLGYVEHQHFKFDVLLEFLKENEYSFVLGLRNYAFKDNPSEEWTHKFKELLTSNEIQYDEYITDLWPASIPEFDIPPEVFVFRYAFDEYNKIDKMASNQSLFEDFMKTSFIEYPNENDQFEKYYNGGKDDERPYKTLELELLKVNKKIRVIVFCSDKENYVLHNYSRVDEK